MRPLGNYAVSQRPENGVDRRGCMGSTHFFATMSARVLVAIARILELGSALKVLEDELVGAATHGRPKIFCRLERVSS
jgi:hypothetical protein